MFTSLTLSIMIIMMIFFPGIFHNSLRSIDVWKQENFPGMKPCSGLCVRDCVRHQVDAPTAAPIFSELGQQTLLITRQGTWGHGCAFWGRFKPKIKVQSSINRIFSSWFPGSEVVYMQKAPCLSRCGCDLATLGRRRGQDDPVPEVGKQKNSGLSWTASLGMTGPAMGAPETFTWT